MKKVLFTLLAAATVLVACDKNETTPVAKDGSREIRFTTNFQTYTVKSESALNEKTVKIIAGAPINQVVEATAADPSTLTPATKLYWAKDQTAKTKFAAIYPSIDVTAAPFDYDVANGDYAFHKDVLFATSGEVAPGQNVALNFAHPFTQVQIAVTNNLEGYDVDAVKVSGLKVNSEVDLLEGTVTPKGENGEIAATKVDAKYNVVIIPQTASPVITVTMKKGEETKNVNFVLAEPVAFVANKIYNAAVTVKAEETPQQVEVSLGFNVTEWVAEATPLAYVEDGEAPDAWTVIGNINATNWDKDFALTAGTGAEAGLLVADIDYRAGNMFKIRNHASWDEAYGSTLAEDAEQAEDQLASSVLVLKADPAIRLSAAGVWHISFNPETKAFKATKTEAVVKDILTVYVHLTGDTPWTKVNLWAWNGGNNFTGNVWPGVEMTETEVVSEITYKKLVLNNVWVPMTLNYIVNDGTTQSEDLTYQLTAVDSKLYLNVSNTGAVSVVE